MDLLLRLPCSVAISLAFLLVALLGQVCGNDKKAAPKKKNLADFNDADIERVFEEWEKDEDPLEPDELPEHLRPNANIDFSKLDTSNPENILKLSKKGKSLMVFVTVNAPNRAEADRISGLWHTGLFNMHMDSQRFMVDDKRAIFMFSDGSKAWDAKDFLVDQDLCEEVVIESKSYPGKKSQKKAESPGTPGKVEL